jgi:hypothetical protein
VPIEQLQGPLQEQHSVDTISAAQILTFTLQTNTNRKTTATRIVSKVEQWKTSISNLQNKEKHKDIKNKKNNNKKQESSYEKTRKSIMV